MSELIVVMGVSGCGKSTIGRALAQAADCPFIEGDAHHPPQNIEKMSSGVALTDRDRGPWIDALVGAVDACPEGAPVVTACSALTPFVQDGLRTARGRDLRFVHLDASCKEIRRRMETRDHFMPVSLLDSQFEALDPPTDAMTFSAALPVDRLVFEIRTRLEI